MNELDFVRVSKAMQTGDLALFFREPGDVVQRRLSSPMEPVDRFHSLAEHADAAGWVLRFVDPAKPLLVFRSGSGGALGIDFFQDVLYASTPALDVSSFVVCSSLRDTDADSARWIAYLERIVACRLHGDTALFDAYSSGKLGRKYFEVEDTPRTLSQWIDFHHALLGRRTFDAMSREYRVWEDHDVYSFT